MKKKVALVYGGKSSEHEVSVKSARNIHKAIDHDRFDVIVVGISKTGTWFALSKNDLFDKDTVEDHFYDFSKNIYLVQDLGKGVLFSPSDQHKTAIDVVFSIIHGTNGEDGTLQGYLKLMNVPFVGCGTLSSALCMDKEHMKHVLTAAGIPNSRFTVVRTWNEKSFDNIVKDLGLPFFIKPANTGSSVGVHKIKSADEFEVKMKDAFLYDHKVVIEEFIQGKEVECAVLGLNHSPKASVVGELIIHHEFYSYEAKYLDQNGADIVIPAQLNEDIVAKIQSLAIKAFKVMGCDGLSRIDFFVKNNGDVYLNELNTLPGFTQISMYPKMWEASGLKYADLITQLIDLAFEKYHLDSKIKNNR